jgi:hypothetical protein
MSDLRPLLVILTILLAACSTVSAGPRLTSAQVIRLADAEARRHGDKYDPRRFKRSDPEYAARFNQWWVRYDPKPGDRAHEAFTIGVDDKTKQAGLILP